MGDDYPLTRWTCSRENSRNPFGIRHFNSKRLSIFFKDVIKPTFDRVDLFDKQIRDTNNINVDITQKLQVEIPFPEQLGQTFVISMRAKRLADFKERFGPWAKYIKHWPGVDGAKLDTTKMYREGTLLPYFCRVGETSLRRGEIGCYLAHYSLWQHIVKNNIKHAFILEDDADIQYSQTVVNRLDRFFADLGRLKMEYDLIYLGHNNCNNPDKIFPNTVIGVPNHCQGCFAYCVTLAGAQKLVQQMMPIKGPVDMIVMEKQNTIKQLSMEPSLCWVVPVWSDTGFLV